MNNEKGIHFVELKEKFISEHPPCTTIKHFVGKLVNQNAECLYFETKDDDLIIVPHSAVYIMYPIDYKYKR